MSENALIVMRMESECLSWGSLSTATSAVSRAARSLLRGGFRGRILRFTDNGCSSLFRGRSRGLDATRDGSI